MEFSYFSPTSCWKTKPSKTADFWILLLLPECVRCLLSGSTNTLQGLNLPDSYRKKHELGTVINLYRSCSFQVDWKNTNSEGLIAMSTLGWGTYYLLIITMRTHNCYCFLDQIQPHPPCPKNVTVFKLYFVLGSLFVTPSECVNLDVSFLRLVINY